MKRTSVFLIGLLWLTTILGPLVFPKEAAAAETQTVYLHKQVTKGEAVTEAALSSNQGMLTEKQGINDVEFTVIDITHYIRNHSSLEAAFDEAKAVTGKEVAGLTIGQAVSGRSGMTVAAKGRTQRTALLDKQGQTIETDGVLKLNLAKKAASYDASYLFVETASVASARPSDNLILNFPTENGEEDIHVYSKNDLLLELPAIEKELQAAHQDFSYNEAIDYEISVTVPTLIATYQYFQVVDIPDKGLSVDLASLQVTANGKDVDRSWYQAEAKDNGFVVNFDPSKLAPLNGQQLRIAYQLSLDKEAQPDTPFYNQAYLRYHNSLQEDELQSISKEVFTGGYRFIKVDAANQKQVLSDAAFVIKNEKDEYLTTDYQWKKTKATGDQELVRIVSNQSGTFEIKGLAYGQYFLEEVAAPKGYRLLDKPIEFTIEKNTYLAENQPAPMLSVLNSKLPSTGNPGTTNQAGRVTTTAATARNSRLLPQTGEHTSMKAVILGALMVAFVFVLLWFNRNKLKHNGGETKR